MPATPAAGTAPIWRQTTGKTMRLLIAEALVASPLLESIVWWTMRGR